MNDFTGSKYAETYKLDLAEIAKLVRKNIKAAVKASDLPKGLKASVRISRYSNGQSLRCTIKKCPGIVIANVANMSPQDVRRWAAEASDQRPAKAGHSSGPRAGRCEMTTAQTVSEIMGGDGRVWKSPEGFELVEVCQQHNSTADAGGKYGDMIKYTFPDSSTIIECGGVWDLGFVDAPDDCFCWPEATHGEHGPHCPHGEAD